MKTVVSFSGGKTSAYMSWWCQHNLPGEKVYIFANTGQEHEKTLEFVDRCDREWNLGVVWVEADVQHDRRAGSKARVVDFATASREGEPFEDVIRKYGLPGAGGYMHCTRELKANPIRAYAEKYGKHQMAIGIRVDEIDRMQPDAKTRGIIYPLVAMHPTDKAAVDRFWQAQSWTLEIPPLLGNCTWCWKKSTRKLLTIMRSDPDVFEFPARMEREYAGKGSDFIFRGRMSVHDLRKSASKPFAEWQEGENLDMFAGCQESCEVAL